MSTGQDTDAKDDLVSAIYRELGDEKAPEHLNRAVLEMAAHPTKGTVRRGRGGFFVTAWMKPVAWAATIGLCLAIVIEYAQIPAPNEQLDVAPAVDSVRDDFAPAERNLLDESETRAKLQSEPSPARADKPVIVDNIDPSTVEPKGNSESYAVSAPAASQPAARGRIDADTSSQTIGAQDVEPVVAEPVAREAEDIAVTGSRVAESEGRSGQSNDAGTLAVTPSARARQALPEETSSEPKKESDSTAACSADSRETAEDWLTCIRELREHGNAAAADREYEDFKRWFPAEVAENETNQ